MQRSRVGNKKWELRQREKSRIGGCFVERDQNDLTLDKLTIHFRHANEQLSWPSDFETRVQGLGQDRE